MRNEDECLFEEQELYYECEVEMEERVTELLLAGLEAGLLFSDCETAS